MLPRKKEISLMQMDGNFTPEEFRQAIELAILGCEKIYEAQREALEKKYSTNLEGE